MSQFGCYDGIALFVSERLIVCSLLSRGNDLEVLVDRAVAVNTSLQSIEHLVTLDELTENGLVPIKVGSSSKCDSELRSSSVLSVVGERELSAFVVSHGQILVLEAQAESTDVLVAHAASRDSKATLSLMEARARVGVALGSFAECAEALSGGGLLVSVELEDEVSEELVTPGNSQVHSWVRGTAVVVQAAEATLANVEELLRDHFSLFVQTIITNY